MASASPTERRIDQLVQRVDQLQRAQKSQRQPRSETNLVKIIGNDVPALSSGGSSDVPGVGLGVPYYIDSNGNLQPHKDASGSNRLIKVYNTSSQAATVGQLYATARMPDGNRILDISSDQSNPTWINFEITQQMSIGHAKAKVITTFGDTVYDFSGSSPVEIGVDSIVDVYDDNFLWPDLVVGCTGKARHRYVGSSSPASHFAIHSSTRPINKVLAVMVDKLTAEKDQIEVKPYHSVLSQPPFTTPGPEWNLAADEYLLVANDWKHHGDSDGVVELERVYNGLQVEDTDPAAAPGDTVTVHWRITRVLDPFPAMIVGTLVADMGTVGYGDVTVAKEFDGLLGSTVRGYLLPELKDTNITPDGNNNWRAGEPVVLRYQKDEDKYYIIGTASAMLGRTALTNLVTEVANTGTAITRTKRNAVAIAGMVAPENTGTVIDFTPDCPETA